MAESNSVEYRVRFYAPNGYAASLPLVSSAKELKERCNFLEIQSPAIAVRLPEYRIDPELEVTAQEFDRLIEFLSDFEIPPCNQLSTHRNSSTLYVCLCLHVRGDSLNDCIKKSTIPLGLSEDKLKDVLFDFEKLTQLLV